MKLINIAIIGLGQIGKRHLESILKINRRLNLYLFDNNIKKINEIKKKYKESE